jgi:molecular chaperone GrpE (heat shock protein)
MSAPEVSLNTLAAGLDELRDLFRRRLLDDREKRQAIDLLHQRIEALERLRSAESLRPLVYRVALVIDRLEDPQAHGPDLLASLADELRDLLASFGVEGIDGSGAFDARRHEVARVDGGTGSHLRVTQVLRHGYEKDGVVLRAAQVAVERAAE